MKHLKNLGKTLNKVEQQQINGGRPPVPIGIVCQVSELDLTMQCNPWNQTFNWTTCECDDITA